MDNTYNDTQSVNVLKALGLKRQRDLQSMVHGM